MKIIYLFLMSIILLLITPDLTAQQLLINKRWKKSFGNPSEINQSASVVDSDGNIITTGNTIVASGTIALLLTKQNSEGTILWQQHFSVSTVSNNQSKNYGVALAIDDSNNIYVAGSSYENETTKHDILILKYTPEGVKLWHNVYNGSGNHDDAAVGIICNTSGSEVYITGSSHGVNSLSDYLTLKLNGNTGTVLWEERYNHPSNLHDIPIALTFNNTGNIIVTGGSATNELNYDLFTLKYSANGSIIDSTRIEGYSRPSALFKDASGNIFITGSTTSDGVNFDILTVKLNANLELAWKQTFDMFGKEDRASDICTDLDGNVFVCGYGSLNEDKKILLALKYNDMGTLLWRQKIGEGVSNAIATKGVVDFEGNYLITGSVKNGDNSYWQTIQLNNEGKIQWSDKHDGISNHMLERPTNITTSPNGDLLVEGISSLTTEHTYSTIKYERWNRTTNYQNDSEGNPSIALNELIVRFDSSAVIKSNIDKLDIVFEKPSFFLKNDVVKNLEERIGTSADRIKLIRIFRELKTSDTHTISRMGEVVPVPDFWTAFKIVYPEDVDINQQIEILENMFPIVRYAHPVYIGYFTEGANDVFYESLQSSLHETTSYPNAHINVEPAWDRTTGEKFVRVGVFDTGIHWKHPDFGYDGSDPTTSNVMGGWDFLSMTALKDIDQPDLGDHGTPVAGIIGALRNNKAPDSSESLGIAGIAGGSWDESSESEFERGVSLYGLKIGETQATGPLAELSLIIDGIMEGAMAFDSTKNYRLGLHIMNHSWIIPSVLDTLDNIQLMSDVVHFANRNKVIFVASRGNNASNTIEYPACYTDSWVMNVSASNEDGKFAENFSSFGNNVDIAAPGTSSIIYTTNTGFLEYGGFSGTSASAPHVTGSAALLLSQFNEPLSSIKNLAPEDVEKLIEKTAVDIEDLPDIGIGYDQYTGWGKLNIGEAMESAYDCPVSHYYSPPSSGSTNIVTTQSASNQEIYLTEPIHTINGVNFQEGNYTANVYSVTATIHHNAQDSILDAWPLHSLSDLMTLDSTGQYLTPHEFITIDTYNQNSAILTGFAFELFSGGVSQGWIPFNPQIYTPKFAYSLQICKTSDVADWETIKTSGIKLFPNPTNDLLNIDVTDINNKIQHISILNIQGQLLLEKSIEHKENLTINTNHLTPGMYLIQLYTDNGVITTKFTRN